MVSCLTERFARQFNWLKVSSQKFPEKQFLKCFLLNCFYEFKINFKKLNRDVAKIYRAFYLFYFH